MTMQIAKAQNATTASLGKQAINEISETLKQLLADVFTLYVKTKGFHWHTSAITICCSMNRPNRSSS